MERLIKIIEALCKRPGLYVACSDMRAVRAFLDGVALGMAPGELNCYPFGGFAHWLEVQHDIYHPAWGWDRILVHAAGSHRAAIASLPERFAVYLQAVADGTFDPFTARERHFGSSCREPDSTITENWHDLGDSPDQAACVGSVNPMNPEATQQTALERQA